jgi:hypothetical protein
VKYEKGFYIPEEGILHSHCRENLKYYVDLEVIYFEAFSTSLKFGTNMVLVKSLKLLSKETAAISFPLFRNTTQQNAENDPSLWSTLALKRDHILELKL